MMQNGIPPETEGKLVLRHPKLWSPEVSNFLEVTSWGTLNDIQKVRSLERFQRHMYLTSILESIFKVCFADSHDSICRICALGYY
jgi:hypothetical protein